MTSKILSKNLQKKLDRLKALKGGSGSGNFNHSERPGEVGGSTGEGSGGGNAGLPPYRGNEASSTTSRTPSSENTVPKTRTAGPHYPKVADRVRFRTSTGSGQMGTVTAYSNDYYTIKDQQGVEHRVHKEDVTRLPTVATGGFPRTEAQGLSRRGHPMTPKSPPEGMGKTPPAGRSLSPEFQAKLLKLKTK